MLSLLLMMLIPAAEPLRAGAASVDITPDPKAFKVWLAGFGRGRQAEFVTDALRALLLEWAGYHTKVFEFISTEHTAKNLMIAAVKRRDRGNLEELAAQARALAASYGLRDQRLAMLLAVPLLIILQTFFSPFQGRLVEKFGPRRLIAIGTVMAGKPVVGEKTWLLSPCGVFRSPIRRGGLLHVGYTSASSFSESIIASTAVRNRARIVSRAWHPGADSGGSDTVSAA